MYDLIVVGSGPAGSSAARAAARAGLDVLILEKEAFPRYKPCGGALSDRAISCLDFPLPQDVCERTVTSARVHFRGKVVEGHKGYRLFTLVTRSKFDQFLLQKAQEAGFNLVTQRVQNYKEKEDHVEVLTETEEYRSKFLVISSGCQSCLKDSIQERATRDQYYISASLRSRKMKRRLKSGCRAPWISTLMLSRRGMVGSFLIEDTTRWVSVVRHPAKKISE